MALNQDKINKILNPNQDTPMINQQPQKQKQLVTNEELKIATSQPAIYCNKFYFSYIGDMVRIAFCEEMISDVGPIITPRNSIVMPAQEFIKFGHAIFQLVNHIQSQNRPEAEKQ